MADASKRRKIYDYFRSVADVLILQETHSVKEVEQVWQNEWGGKIIFSHGSSNARGIAILVKVKSSLIFRNICSDIEGRYIITDIEENGAIITCAAIYAPNKDSPQFFSDIAQLLRERNERKVIIGDFNLVLDVEMDRLNTYNNNEKALKEVENVMDEFSMREVWRDRNPHTRQFSWRKNAHNRDKYKEKASRIDFALVSAGLDQKTENCMYKSGILSDHKAFFIVIDINFIERGVGYWKFNNLLFQNKEFLDLMKKELTATIESSQQQNPIRTWENIKQRIKKSSISFSRNRAVDEKVIISQLSETVNELEERLPLEKEEYDLLEKSRTDLEEKLDERIKGVMFRSKARWFEQGERNSKYFFALEKSKYNAKTCFCLYDSEEKLVTNPYEILEIQEQFYAELYKEDSDVKFTLTNNTGVRVPKELREQQDKPIELGNLQEAIKSMKNNRTPGYDGIPVDFYKVFWADLKTPFLAMVQQVFLEEKLYDTARLGILNKDTRHVKNLRPITLLNTDYKIIEKAVANMMIPALDTIIHSDQRGFMKNRRISVNIRKLLDIIHYTKVSDIEALVLSLDFVKCFDKCSFSILHGSLDFFNFGETVKKWTKILYKNFVVKIQNNGHFSPEIRINKGVHQGGCCSAIYFLVIAEILAMALRENPQIEGITIAQIKNLLNQFADDADVFSMNNEQSIKAIFSELESFRKQSGFTISYDKTVLYRIGSLRHSSAMLYNIDQVAWSNEDITVLGITVAHQDIVRKNYSKLQEKVHSVLNAWQNRGLTLMGKVLVVNTLIASLFVYKMMVLPNMPDNIIKVIENEIRKYLWGGKKAKIAYQMLQNSVETGGLNLVNFRNKECALKATWPQILYKEKDYAQMIYGIIGKGVGEWIWRANLSIQHVESIGIEDDFWKDTLKAWCRFNFNHRSFQQNQILWMNSNVLIQNKPVIWHNAMNAGLMYVYQLFEDGEMKTSRQLMEEFKLNIMQCNSLVTCISKRWKEIMCEQSKHAFLPLIPHNYDVYRETQKLVKLIYYEINGDNTLLQNKLVKWNMDLKISWSLESYLSYFVYIRKLSNHTKVRDFQYRLLHRALITNVHLYKWGMIETELCTFCGKDTEHILHLLFTCEKIRTIWEQLQTYIEQEYKVKIMLTEESVISNLFCKPKLHVANAIALYLKQFIYSCRCLKKEPIFDNFTRFLCKIRNTEKYIAVKNDNYRIYKKKWECNVVVTTQNCNDYINNYCANL